MRINISSEDKVRIEIDQGNNFVDVYGLEYELGIVVDLYFCFYYMEVR